MTVILRAGQEQVVRLTQIPAVGPPGTMENFSIDGAAPFHFMGGIPGSLVVAAGVHRLYPNRPGTIGQVDVSLGAAPTGADAIFDINLNGFTIFTTQSNRPRVLDGQNVSLGNVPDIVDFEVGDYFTIDCDQRGAIAWGSAATITIWYF